MCRVFFVLHITSHLYPPLFPYQSVGDKLKECHFVCEDLIVWSHSQKLKEKASISLLSVRSMEHTFSSYLATPLHQWHEGASAWTGGESVGEGSDAWPDRNHDGGHIFYCHIFSGTQLLGLDAVAVSDDVLQVLDNLDVSKKSYTELERTASLRIR